MIPSIGEATERLPYPRALFHKVEFWKSVYTKYKTTEGILHDSDDLSIVYGRVALGPNRSEAPVNEFRAKIRNAIFGILQKRGQNLSTTERKVLSKFPKYASRSRLLQAAENIRFQLGQSDRFREGVIRSGRYMKSIERIVKEEGLPDFIKYLPHVESSFQEFAVSKTQAAGLWQLMPRTARQFIRVNLSIDERFDPWVSTEAAVKYLKQNYRRLESWPLALTAYNHGAGGVLRAVRTLGTKDIAEIAFRYSTPRFGFASRNFYAQFLAAVQVAQNYKKYFGNIKLDEPIVFDEIKLERSKRFRDIKQEYRFVLEEFKKLNPGLRAAVYRNRRRIPTGSIVRFPKGSKIPDVMVASLDKKSGSKAKPDPKLDLNLEIKAKQKLKKVSKSVGSQSSVQEKEEEVPTIEDVVIDSKYAVNDVSDKKGWIRVGINETVAQFADWLNTTPEDLREWNSMGKRGQARLGQRLIVKFTRTTQRDFELSRSEYHKQIREDYFAQYQVDSFLDYVVQVGENLWSVCYQKFDIPPWLLQEFNPGVVVWDLKPGQKLKIPVLTERLFAVDESSDSSNSN